MDIPPGASSPASAVRSILSRADNLAAHERYHEKQEAGSTIELEGDLFTNAFVSSLGLPDSKGRNPHERFLEILGPCSQMSLVTLIQILMAWAVYLHVVNDLIMTKSRPLYTAYEMFVGTNITMPLGTVVQLCGQWEDQEMKDFAVGPLSTMKMPDGSVYSADDSYSLFYNLKQPTRSWDYGRLGSERSVLDDVMFVLSEGVSLNPATPSGYSLLFILTISIFFFSISVELREILHFVGMLGHFWAGRRAAGPCWRFDKDTDKFELIRISPVAQYMGMFAMLCRLTVAAILGTLGTTFLLYTSLKMDLILNGLAILFVLELDNVIYVATISDQRKKFISDIKPVVYARVKSKAVEYGPVWMFPLMFLFAVAARAYQCHIFGRYFKMVSAVCLFAGPTTPFARQDIAAPVTGFCDSLLGVSCAPHVEPEETARRHGYCVITDQTAMTSPTVQFYLDDPAVFANRYNEDGSMKSWVDWGDANPALFKAGRWMNGPYQNLLRKQCLQMYQITTKPDDVLVDDDVGETMDGAPFHCAKKDLFEAVFGKVRDAVGKLPTEEAILKTADLSDPAVVRAIDRCKISAKSASPALAAAHAPASPAAVAASPAAVAAPAPASPAPAAAPALAEATSLYAKRASQNLHRKHHRVAHLRKHAHPRLVTEATL